MEGNHLAELVGCALGDWPLVYLGHNINLGNTRRSAWFPLVRKVKVKFSCWKSRLLNKEGRTTLLKATINNLPIYWMNLTLIPKGVISKIDSYRRAFFLGRSKSSGPV